MRWQFIGDRMAKKGGLTHRHKSCVYFVTKLAVLCFGQGSLILIAGTVFDSLSPRTWAHGLLDLLQHILVSPSWISNFKFIWLAIRYFIAQCCLRSLDVLCHWNAWIVFQPVPVHLYKYVHQQQQHWDKEHLYTHIYIIYIRTVSYSACTLYNVMKRVTCDKH